MSQGTGGVVGPRRGKKDGEWNVLESPSIEGERPVHEAIRSLVVILSSAGHVESCVNLPGPSGKAKYK